MNNTYENIKNAIENEEIELIKLYIEKVDKITADANDDFKLHIKERV